MSDSFPSDNLSPHQMFKQLAERHVPIFNFEADSVHSVWKAAALPRVLETLGKWPPRCSPQPQLLAEWQDDGLRKQKWRIEVGPAIAATLLINYPGDLREGEKRAALLCWHGHEAAGKKQCMGNSTADNATGREGAYGHQMAKAGFVTFAIDWMGGGERNDSNKPHFSAANFGRDWCNLYYLLSTMLGMTSLSMNITHGMAATDFVCTLPEVDAERLGVMGASGGGTMTLWSALCDDRLKAAEIICYSGLWKDFLYTDLNACGMQVAPGLYALVDLPELQGLLAPKPLLVDIGAYDDCFSVESAMACQGKLEQIYGAAGASDALELELSAGGHAWPHTKSLAFFEKHLVGR